ncbi:hypothetical protein CRUP_022752, partial [Coryphaenoides rupestris]
PGLVLVLILVLVPVKVQVLVLVPGPGPDRGYCDCAGQMWPTEGGERGEEGAGLTSSTWLMASPFEGTCHCGSCMCRDEDGRGLVTGTFCECDDSECLDEDTGEVCGGHGQCYCGNCYCAAGWHGDKCEYQCDISPWESKQRCTSPDGKICSNRGQPQAVQGDVQSVLLWKR